LALNKKPPATLSHSDSPDRVSQPEALVMEERDMAAGRQSEEELGARFAEKPRPRSRREEVVEILAEGLWALICDGRGPRSRPADPLTEAASCDSSVVTSVGSEGESTS
jgi:hypothetical protein